MALYWELPPPPELQRFLACFWVHENPREHDPLLHRVLPDGCVDVISGLRTEPTVVGPMTRYAFAELGPGTVIVGARFKPGIAPAFLRCESSLLLDSEPEMSALFPLSEEFDRLAEGSVYERLGCLQDLLARRLDGAEPDWLATASAHALWKEPATSIVSLSDSLGLSERQLLRRFEAAVGYAPSVYRRVARLQRLARLPTDVRRSMSLARVASDAGYADQAHMNRDVRQLTGLTPKQLLTA